MVYKHVKCFLSLDISSVRTGFAIFKNNKVFKYGDISLSHIDKHSERLFVFEKELMALFENYKPEIVIAEDIYKGQNAKTHKILSLYHGIVYKLCFQFLKDDPIVLYTGEIRSPISEKFNVKLKQPGIKDKVLTFNFIKSHFGYDTFNYDDHNDTADAIAIGLAVTILEEKQNGSLQDFRGCARSRRKGAKNRLSKASASVPSGQEPRKQRSRRKVQTSK